MRLCIILGVIKLNTTFYISFTFLFLKTYTNYYQVFSTLQQFYYEVNISNLIFIGTNHKKALIWALEVIISNLKHALYLWHIDKNMLTNCKSSFDTKETWKIFYDDQHKFLFTSTEPVFKER